MTLCFEVFDANTDATDLAYTWGLEDGVAGIAQAVPLAGRLALTAYGEGFTDGRKLAARFERREVKSDRYLMARPAA